MFDELRKAIADVKASAELIAVGAAPIIERRLTRAATTRRGNVPSYSPGGPDVPITATAQGDEIRVRSVDWVMRTAIARNQPDEWLADVQMVAERIGEGK